MKIYVVKKGDTLYFISQKHNVSIEEILKLNPAITNPDVLDVGMKLKIPSTSGGTGGMDIMHQHVVKQGDTLWKLSKAWGVPLADMIKANPQLKNPNVLLTGEIVNIPKSGHGSAELPAAEGIMNETASGGGLHPLHPMSLMQGVQGLVGKKPTGQIPTQTSPAAGKTPTAQMPTQTSPIAGKTPTAPITEPKPTAPIEKPVAPVAEKPMPIPTVKPNVPAPAPAPKSVAVKPTTKTLPIEKPAEKKVLPIHAENKPNMDLFQQFNIPATEASSPIQQQPIYNGYGYSNPSVSPAQGGTGYGGWAQPMPFGANVSPISENGPGHFICPPGTIPIADAHAYGYGYGHEAVSPVNAGPETYGYSYGHGIVSPINEGPETYGYGYGHGVVSPVNSGPDCDNGEVSPAGWGPVAYNHGYGYGHGHHHGMVSPANVGPGHGHGYGYSSNQISPAEMGPNSVMPSQMGPNAWPQNILPTEMGPNNVMPSQMGPNAWPQNIMPTEMGPNNVMPSQMGPNAWPQNIMPTEMGPNNVLPSQMGPNTWPQNIMPTEMGPNSVLPADIGPNAGWPGQVSPESQGYGYGHGQVSPAGTGPHGYGYGYPAWGFPPFPPYSTSPTQTAGVAEKPCGCKDKREDEAIAKLDAQEETKSKTVIQRKGGKKAVIRTVAARSRQSKRNSRPWINR